MGLAFDIFFTRPVGATGKNARISAVKSSRDVIHCAYHLAGVESAPPPPGESDPTANVRMKDRK